MHRVFLNVGMVFLAAGCAAKKPVEPENPLQGDVAVRQLQTETSERYAEPAPGEKYDYPLDFAENAPPVYPGALLAKQLPPVRMKVRIIVDEQGTVAGSEPLESAAESDPAFLGAVQDAVRAWKFTPLVRISESSGRTDIYFQDVVITYPGKATALPFHQDYEFTFMQRDGQGFVSTQAPAQ